MTDLYQIVSPYLTRHSSLDTDDKRNLYKIRSRYYSNILELLNKKAIKHEHLEFIIKNMLVISELEIFYYKNKTADKDLHNKKISQWLEKYETKNNIFDNNKLSAVLELTEVVKKRNRDFLKLSNAANNYFLPADISDDLFKTTDIEDRIFDNFYLPELNEVGYLFKVGLEMRGYSSTQRNNEVGDIFTSISAFKRVSSKPKLFKKNPMLEMNLLMNLIKFN